MIFIKADLICKVILNQRYYLLYLIKEENHTISLTLSCSLFNRINSVLHRLVQVVNS